MTAQNDNSRSEPCISFDTGAELRELRLSAGVSQVGLADAAGLAKSNLALIEKGKRTMGKKVAARLATALGECIEERREVRRWWGTARSRVLDQPALVAIRRAANFSG